MVPLSSPGKYHVTFEERSGYLYAHISGKKASFAIARKYWTDIAERAISSEVKKLLVVEDIPEAITISEVHRLVTELSELPVKDIRVAFVDQFAQHKSLNDFGILVAGNRGLSLRGFDSIEAAEEWLLSD